MECEEESMKEVMVSKEEEQREITRLVAEAGYLLLHNGVESKVVSDVSRRIGRSLGIENVEIALTASAIIITTRLQGHCLTTIRQCISPGINMRIVSEVQQICIATERGELDIAGVHERLAEIDPPRYNHWLVVVMIGIACAAFCRLAGGNTEICGLTFLASSIGMIVRQTLVRNAFNALITFGVTAFITSLISGLGFVFHLGEGAFLAMASSVLMLVPGFPLINSVSDMLKGYVTMGISRWTTATLLTLATSMGIVGAMQILEVWAWL